MGGSKPKRVEIQPPPPPPPLPTSVESPDSGESTVRRVRRRGGYRKQIVTGSLTPSVSGKKSRLGGG